MKAFFLLLGMVAAYFFVSLLTCLVRRYAIKSAILDYPNERSSHTHVTPKGAGAAIAAPFMVVLLIMAAAGWLRSNDAAALIGGGAIVSWAGWMADRGRGSIRLRLALHFTAVLWVLVWLGGAPSMRVGSIIIDWPFVNYCLAFLGAVWLINLYNFMDGIDGIAAVEAITTALAAGVLFYIQELYALAYASALLAAFAAGFLSWNWPPAKIFMGDVGSGFLGFLFAVLALISARQAPETLWAWAILLGVFLADSMVTLIRRLRRGTKWHEAHKRHAYQHAARRFGHKAVTLAVFAINIFWLVPLALWAALNPSHAFIAFIIAYVPLVFLAFRFKSGEDAVIV